MSLDLETFAGMPQDDSGPVFNEPWEAQAFALAVELNRQGLFTWKEWAGALADEIRAARDAGRPDRGDTYYQHWTRALTRLVATKGEITPAELEDRTDRWRRAYLATPHGQPVELSAAGSDTDGIDESNPRGANLLGQGAI